MNIFEQMLELAGRMNIQIRHVHLGGSGGGMVKLRGQRQVFIDQDADAADQLEMLAGALGREADINQHEISPDLRQQIERFG